MTSQSHSDPMTFTEIFKVKIGAIPPLFLYTLNIRNTDRPTKLGRKLADRLKRRLGGHWVWSESFLVADLRVDQSVLDPAIREIRKLDPDTFKPLVDLQHVDAFPVTPRIQADFMAFGLFGDIGNEIKAALPLAESLGQRARVERQVDIRGWVIQGEPMISMSIDSNVIFNQDLSEYAATCSNPDELIGLGVADKVFYDNGGRFKGEIQQVSGRLDANARQSLLDIR